MRPARSLALLTLFFLLLALATSRLTLLMHELVGHGGAALLVGSTIRDYRLFWLAGGWIDFARAEPYGHAEACAVYLGGIALELVTGAVLLAISRRARAGSSLRITLLGFAAIDLVHAGYYATAGAFHGFGDGWLLRRMLGDHRLHLVLPATVALLAGACALARLLVAHVRLRVPGERHPVAIIAAAALLAGIGHGALSFGELALARDRTYEQTMRHQSDRDVARELAGYVQKARAERGAPPDASEVAAVQRRLRAEHAEIPFARILVVLLAAAMLFGMARAPVLDPAHARPLAGRDLVLPAALLALGLALIAALEL